MLESDLKSVKIMREAKVAKRPTAFHEVLGVSDDKKSEVLHELVSSQAKGLKELKNSLNEMAAQALSNSSAYLIK